MHRGDVLGFAEAGHRAAFCSGLAYILRKLAFPVLGTTAFAELRPQESQGEKSMMLIAAYLLSRVVSVYKTSPGQPHLAFLKIKK